MQALCLLGAAHHFPSKQSVSACFAMMKYQPVCIPKSPDGAVNAFWAND